MKYLHFQELKALLNAGKQMEQLLNITGYEKYSIINYITLFRGRKSNYCVCISAVYDDRDKGVENIYSFEPVDPDAPEGKLVYFETFEEAINYSITELMAKENKFIVIGYLQDELVASGL